MDRQHRKQPAGKERPNDVDRTGGDRHERKGRTGEGSESALASLKRIERERARATPHREDGSGD